MCLVIDSIVTTGTEAENRLSPSRLPELRHDSVSCIIAFVQEVLYILKLKVNVIV